MTVSTRVGALRRLTLVLACLLILSACSSDDTYLPALLADPVAAYDAEGIELIDSWEQPEGLHFFTDEPVHAEVGRVYRILDQKQAERILSETVSYAESQGWRVRASSISPTNNYRGVKQLNPGNGRLSVAVGPDARSSHDDALILRIPLDYGTVRFESTTTSIAGGNG